MTPAPHRLVLTAGELTYLVERTGVELPPGWEVLKTVRPAACPCSICVTVGAVALSNCSGFTEEMAPVTSLFFCVP